MSKDNHQLHLLIEDVGPILYTGDVTWGRKQNPKNDTKRDVTSPGGGVKFAVWRFVSSPSTANL